ncbi:MAG: hypothetical protein WBO70_01145, partial [Erysipelotrichaceae bacterium]
MKKILIFAISLILICNNLPIKIVAEENNGSTRSIHEENKALIRKNNNVSNKANENIKIIYHEYNSNNVEIDEKEEGLINAHQKIKNYQNLFSNIKGFEFKGWSTTINGEVEYLVSDKIRTSLELYPVFSEKEKIKAKFYILDPKKPMPADGVDQYVDNYLPNSKDNGGVEGLNSATGYEGYIT